MNERDVLARRFGRPRPGDPDAGMQATGGLLPGPGAQLVGPDVRAWLDEQ